jgi:hypothetical protein
MMIDDDATDTRSSRVAGCLAYYNNNAVRTNFGVSCCFLLFCLVDEHRGTTPDFARLKRSTGGAKTLDM